MVENTVEIVLGTDSTNNPIFRHGSYSGRVDYAQIPILSTGEIATIREKLELPRIWTSANKGHTYLISTSGPDELTPWVLYVIREYLKISDNRVVVNDSTTHLEGRF